MAMHNPPHPGEFIQDTYMVPFGVSCRNLATKLDVFSTSVMSLIYAPGGYLSNMTPEGYDTTSNGGSFSVTCDTLNGASLISGTTRHEYLGFFGSSGAGDSIYNALGDYGRITSTTSINNPLSLWGSASDQLSAYNSTATFPPRIRKHGRRIGDLTTNSSRPGAISPTVCWPTRTDR